MSTGPRSRTPPPGDGGPSAFAEELSAEVAVGPLLQRVLTHSTELLGGAAGSISLVDEGAGLYRKAAEQGVDCRSGQVFPLEEGVTGRVVAGRRPVVLDRYDAVPGGHLPAGDPVARGAVVAVPIWWRGEIIGADVVFGGGSRRFTATDVERLEQVAQTAAVALTYARRNADLEASARRSTAAEERAVTAKGFAAVLLELRALEERLGWERLTPTDRSELRAGLGRVGAVIDAELSNLRRRAADDGTSALSRPLVEILREESGWLERNGRIQVRVSVAGSERELAGACRQVAVRIAREAVTNAALHAAPTLFRLGLVYGPSGLTLLALDDGSGFVPAGGGAVDAAGGGLRRMAADAGSVNGTFSAESIPGWGTVIRAHIPYGERQRTPGRGLAQDELTPRERAVLALLRHGRTDQQVAVLLGISSKTVEKHVSHILHKLGAQNRTEAVARALERGVIEH